MTRIKTLAARERVSAAYMTRVIRLTFLNLRVTDTVMAGRLRVGINEATLMLDP